MKLNIPRSLHNFGHNVYICPKCFNTIYIKTKHKILDLEVECGDNDNLALECIRLSCDIRCINCDEYMFEADFNIAEYIPILNKNGVKTLYPCGGHRQFFQHLPDITVNNGDISVFPYISFSAIIEESKLNLIKDILKDNEYVHLELDNFDDPDIGPYSFYTIRGGRCINYTDDEISDTFMMNEINISINRFQIALNDICNSLINAE